MPAMFKTAAAFMLSLPLLCQADLIGTSVTGSLQFVDRFKNFFDPANGMVPTGVGNTSSKTVTIGQPLVEFGFEDSFSRITADFTAFHLTISEAASSGGGATVEHFNFYDDAFIGRVAVPTANSYPASPTVNLTEDTLYVDFPGDYEVAPGSTTAITFALTLPGDANLNGTVDFNDFLVLQNNFNQPNTTFTLGDFNFDSQTDFNDFLVLQNNFGNSVTGSSPAVAAAEVAAMTAFAATVPEPAMIGVLGLMAAAMLRRKGAGAC